MRYLYDYMILILGLSDHNWHIHFTQYDGTMEYQYATSRNTPNNDFALASRIVHNAEGYVKYAYIRSSVIPKSQMPPRLPIVIQSQYYYHRDHLGNNCVVWDATNDSIAQRTWYYASGTPMSISTVQGVQPYKYNGKEYIEAHGYDVYDYGFRGYYATIGRFTAIAPLCERTPWQSPYAYANNNWINQIDYAGLFGAGFSQGSCNWVAVDNFAKVLGSDMNSSDKGVYLVDNDDWDGTYNGLLDYSFVGWQMPGINYIVGGYYDFIAADLSGAYLSFGGGNFGFMALPVTSVLPSKESSTNDIIADIVAVADITNEIIGNFRSNELFWIGANGRLYFNYQAKNNYCYARSQRLAKIRNAPLKQTTERIGAKLSIAGIALEGMDIYANQALNISNVVNTGIIVVSVVTASLSIAPFIAGAVMIYTSADLILGWTTGMSISDRMNQSGPLLQW